MVDRLTVEHGQVWLGDDLLPGIFRELWVRGEAVLDEVKMQSGSGKTHQPNGWTDMDVSLSLDLLTDDSGNCYAKLSAMNRIFRGADGHSDPKVFDLRGNPHLTARGIDQVIFAGLDSFEDDRDDVVYATLHFVEDRPVVTRAEAQVNAGNGAAVTPTADTTETSDTSLSEDDSNPFMDGYREMTES